MTMAKNQRPEGEPHHNFDVTEASGYEFEAKVSRRFANGWGGTQTRLPNGHLARRDALPEANQADQEKAT